MGQKTESYKGSLFLDQQMNFREDNTTQELCFEHHPLSGNGTSRSCFTNDLRMFNWIFSSKTTEVFKKEEKSNMPPDTHHMNLQIEDEKYTQIASSSTSKVFFDTNYLN